MTRIFLVLLCILLNSTCLHAQEYRYFQDLKRPRYSAIQEESPKNQAQQNTTAPKTEKKNQPDNEKFCGRFKGMVTVHYQGQMVRTQAALKIAIEEPESKSHYDYYILPANSTYMENTWALEKSTVRRSVTISGNTVYITDIIEYGDHGGNSQIRTLVFSDDHSALTFLKTEFDDAARNSATGQIIGRFTRSK